MNNKNNKFWKYYNKWKKETAFLSVGNFDNKNFEALCDPDKVPVDEMIYGSLDILTERDDFIVHALDKYFDKYFDGPMFIYKGFVPLSYCCKGWKVVLTLMQSDKSFEEKRDILHKAFEIVEK